MSGGELVREPKLGTEVPSPRRSRAHRRSQVFLTWLKQNVAGQQFEASLTIGRTERLRRSEERWMLTVHPEKPRFNFLNVTIDPNVTNQSLTGLVLSGEETSRRRAERMAKGQKLRVRAKIKDVRYGVSYVAGRGSVIVVLEGMEVLSPDLRP